MKRKSLSNGQFYPKFHQQKRHFLNFPMYAAHKVKTNLNPILCCFHANLEKDLTFADICLSNQFLQVICEVCHCVFVAHFE